MGDIFQDIGNVINAFIIGGLEGIIAPVFEFVVVIMLFTMQSVQQSTQVIFNQTPSYVGNLPIITVGTIYICFTAILFFENFFTGLLGNIVYNFGYCTGAIIGIFYFWKIFTIGFFQEAIFNTITAVIIIAIGISIRFYAMMLSQKKNPRYESQG